MFRRPSKEEETLLTDKAKALESRFYGLTHELFKNNQKGAEWLELVTDSFVLNRCIANPSLDEKHAFFNEGIATFVRNIHQVIKLHELNAKQATDNK